MTRIIVVPETLRSLSSQLQRAAQEINAVSGRVSGALGGLDWETRQKASVDGQVNDARGRASTLASQAETMARYLANKAQAFEQADMQSTADLDSVIRQYPVPVPIPVPTPAPNQEDAQSFPLPSPDTPARSELERLLNTLWALKPVVLDLLLKKLGLDTIKDVFDLTQIQKHMDEMDRAREAWLEARLQYGSDSPQAIEAREKYYDTYGNMPILGPFIKAALDMGRANPVY